MARQGLTAQSRCFECRRLDGARKRAFHIDVETGRVYCDDHWNAYREAVIAEEYPAEGGLIGHATHTSRILRGL
jgi:hypothetical protein